jgi:putative Mg2+ transporter-C (MgtC) family protein
VAVLFTNVALRPLAYKLRPEMKQEETDYHLELICSAKDETQVRGLLLNAVERSQVGLNSLDSEDLETGDRVRVSATIKTTGRKDDALEQVVARVSLVQSVTSVRWRVEPTSAAME